MYMPNELLDVLRGGYVSMVGKKAWLKPEFSGRRVLYGSELEGVGSYLFCSLFIFEGELKSMWQPAEPDGGGNDRFRGTLA
mmetsp:Transcript_40272/g.99837  ORF Transcript_40272/g.99837 Transcript_40272/m.99837 type:complete len:81 (-) Transcript_40272:1241-1483(-)